MQYRSRQSVKISSKGDCSTALQPVAGPCHAPPAGAFLSLRPTGISLTEIVTVLFCLQAATWGRPYLLCNYPRSS